jgi:hypothetical protein
MIFCHVVENEHIKWVPLVTYTNKNKLIKTPIPCYKKRKQEKLLMKNFKLSLLKLI